MISQFGVCVTLLFANGNNVAIYKQAAHVVAEKWDIFHGEKAGYCTYKSESNYEANSCHYP